MKSATTAVCFADSDDEDYVSFDEDELNTGIANLYDEDSASDYNDDVEEEEEVDLENINIVQEAIHPIPPPPQQPAPQQQQQQALPSKARFSFNLFGSNNDNNNNNNNSNEKRKDSDSGGGLMSAFSARSAAPKRNKKKSKSSQLNKRINRLREHQHKSRAVKKDKNVVHRQKVNTNVISVDLGTLKNAAENIATGDPFICGSCKCMLSKHDELLKKFEEIKLDDDDDSIWVCSFCNHINIIQIDEEEIPKAETVDYILAPPPTTTDDAKQAESNKNESQIIFCIDVSGSMCVSQQIDSKHSHFKLRGNRLQKEHDNLSQFIDHNANHLNQQSEIQYVSRLQCVQTAVKEQIDNIAKSNPNYKLGLVSFNNEVTVIGDGMSTHEIVTGDKLNDIEKLKEIGMKCIINNNIETAKDKLSEALWKLEENGQTALGPALVVSIAMASAKPGSQVILCTDGLANIGVGSLDQVDNQKQQKDKAVNDQIESEDDDEEEEEDPVLKWYQALGDYAMSKGVVVNIISITDDGCKLENLGKIVEITGGSLKRINPLNLAEKFSGIIENESIATNCQAKMLLHPGLKFHNTVDAAQIKDEDEENEESKKKKKSAAKPQTDEQKDDKEPMDVDKENEDDSDKMNEGRKIYKIPQSVQDCGNVFEGSRIFFEYVINKEKRSEFKTLKQLPFQTQIEYSKKDGTKMLRVISQTKEITFDRKKVRDNLDFNVLAKYGTHVTTELCAKGDYESSRAWTAANTRYMNNNANNSRQLLQLANYAQENVVLDHQMQRQIQSEFLEEAPKSSMMMSSNNNNNDDMFSGFTYSNSSAKSSKRAKKKKMKFRQSTRNDQFSSAVYNMKKKSHK